VNLVTRQAVPKHDLLFNKLAYGAGLLNFCQTLAAQQSVAEFKARTVMRVVIPKAVV
jgi:hypothetical protein